MVVTQQEIADRLGVSRRLVGAALSGNPRVSAATRQRVEAMATTLGYRPNGAARALVTGRHFQVALFLPSLDGQFLADLIRQFERLARGTHYSLVVLKYSEDTDLNTVPSVDGSIAYVMPRGVLPHLGQKPQVQLRPKPYASPGPEVANGPTTDVVYLDMDHASTELVEHLIREGRKRIAIVSPQSMLQAGLPRYEAYLRAMHAAGLTPEAIDVSVPPDSRFRETVDQQLSSYFKQHGYPEALVCSNDELAIGAYRALRRAGRCIPLETAVTGCDNIEEGEDACPTLTTIHLNTEIACQNAWNLLMNRLDNLGAPVTTVTVQAQAIFRDSSRIAG